MIRNYLLILVLLFTTQGVIAQITDNFPEDRRRQREDLPLGIKETLQKRKIEQEKKEHKELLDRGHEALKLAEELSASVNSRNNLSEEEKKKLEKLEKLIRKIRDRLGGDDDGEDTQNSLKSTEEALEIIKENTNKLLSILEKTSRFEVSARAIEISNNILKIIQALQP